MQLLSVNLGKPRVMMNGKSSGETGIYKRPQVGAVRVMPLGLEGDTVRDLENHGGLDQAVYVYGMPDYDWWTDTLGDVLEPGTFGENLTISDLESAALSIGDRLCVGEVLLEVTAARIPCATLAVRMDDPTFIKRFRRAERPGVYCRVIEAGSVRAGDPVTLQPYEGEKVSVIEMFRLFYERDPDEEDLLRALASPLAFRARRDIEERLEALRLS